MSAVVLETPERRGPVARVPGQPAVFTLAVVPLEEVDTVATSTSHLFVACTLRVALVGFPF